MLLHLVFLFSVCWLLLENISNDGNRFPVYFIPGSCLLIGSDSGQRCKWSLRTGTGFIWRSGRCTQSGVHVDRTKRRDAHPEEDPNACEETGCAWWRMPPVQGPLHWAGGGALSDYMNRLELEAHGSICVMTPGKASLCLWVGLSVHMLIKMHSSCWKRLRCITKKWVCWNGTPLGWGCRTREWNYREISQLHHFLPDSLPIPHYNHRQTSYTFWSS